MLFSHIPTMDSEQCSVCLLFSLSRNRIKKDTFSFGTSSLVVACRWFRNRLCHFSLLEARYGLEYYSTDITSHDRCHCWYTHDFRLFFIYSQILKNGSKCVFSHRQRNICNTGFLASDNDAYDRAYKPKFDCKIFYTSSLFDGFGVFKKIYHRVV